MNETLRRKMRAAGLMQCIGIAGAACIILGLASGDKNLTLGQVPHARILCFSMWIAGFLLLAAYVAGYACLFRSERSGSG